MVAVSRLSRDGAVVCWVLPGPRGTVSSLKGFALGRWGTGGRSGTGRFLNVLHWVNPSSLPCSGVPTVRPLYVGNANSLIFFMMVNLIGNKSTLKFIGSSQGLVSRVIKHLIISGNANCIFNFICTLTFALAKNSLYKWD